VEGAFSARNQGNRMIPKDTNPFHELFVTDSAPADEFVRYFSPFLVPHLPELFQDGNVVLKGTQGCGKSMLLKLLTPEVRVAYAERNEELLKNGQQGIEFPVPEAYRDFVGAGVNLSKSGVLDIAQLLPSGAKESDFQVFTALFSDFLNYWLLRDLIESLQYIAENKKVFGQLVNPFRLDEFTEAISSQDCWFGYFSNCHTFAAFRERVAHRVLSYRSWNARNIPTLADDILKTKTVIGEPLSRTVQCLKEAQVLGRNVPVFLRIDQMEELWHREGNQAQLTHFFRQTINRVIGSRDLRVSFRVGTRRYAWSGDLEMPGGRQIEEFRDYLVIDLDQRLRRREDRAGWLFEGFASDVFRHRVAAEPEEDPKRVHSQPITPQSYFGSSPTPHELLEKLIVTPPEDPLKLLKLDENWSPEWRTYVFDIYHKRLNRKKPKTSAHYPANPLDALLAVAWGLQTGGVKGSPPKRFSAPPTHLPPWTPWWEKERLMLAVMQLVVRHQQTLFWWGTEKILALSASNITLFLSICREVWDQWRRRSFDEGVPTTSIQRRSKEAVVFWKSQAVAIDNVSKAWHRNFARQPGRPGGDVRMRFVDALGTWLRRTLLADHAMSYPGGNGFSLRESDLDAHEPLSRLLEEAVGWGDLYEVSHTTKLAKEKHKDPRKKYYLNPILSPHYQIPEAHTKEPLYESVDTILHIAAEARALLPGQRELALDTRPANT
jgi:hypothetical protein